MFLLFIGRDSDKEVKEKGDWRAAHGMPLDRQSRNLLLTGTAKRTQWHCVPVNTFLFFLFSYSSRQSWICMWARRGKKKKRKNWPEKRNEGTAQSPRRFPFLLLLWPVREWQHESRPAWAEQRLCDVIPPATPSAQAPTARRRRNDLRLVMSFSYIVWIEIGREIVKDVHFSGQFIHNVGAGCHLILGSSIFDLDHTQRLRNEPRIGQPEVVSISWSNLWNKKL